MTLISVMDITLDFKRACTAAECEACWLCSKLPLWNKVLNLYGLNLAEFEPGKLSLTSFKTHPSSYLQSHRTSRPQYTTTFFIAWLPRKHQCLHAMRLSHPLYVASDGVTSVMFDCASQEVATAGNASNLRFLQLQKYVDIEKVCNVLRTSVGSLETIDLSERIRSMHIPQSLASLVHRSTPRINRFGVDGLCRHDRWGMLHAVLQCPMLTDLTVQLPFMERFPWTVADLLQHCGNLEKLCLDLPEPEWSRSYTRLDEAFAANHRLTELRVTAHSEVLCRAMCKAVTRSPSVKTFHLSTGWQERHCIEWYVASLLSKNSVLEALKLAFFEICPGGAERLARGLADNTTLMTFDVSKSTADASAFASLVGALERNSTLKKLRLGKFPKTTNNGRLLLALSTHFGRVEVLPWTDEVVSTLAPTLLSGTLSPEHVQLAVSDKMSGDSLRCLGAALGGTRSVKTLTLHVSGEVSVLLGTSLYYVLKAMKSVSTLRLRGAANINRPLTQPSKPPPKSRQWLLRLLRKSSSVSRVEIAKCFDGVKSWFELAPALRDSLSITSFEVSGLCCDTRNFAVHRGVTRNLTRLNDAVRFVTRANVGRRCGLAFETLAAMPSLREQIGKVTGKSEAECEAAVRSARAFLAENFFVLAGVVCGSLECHPGGEGVQLDALNAACLQAIAGHVKLSDVVFESAGNVQS